MSEALQLSSVQGLLVFCLAMFVTLTIIPLLLRYSAALGLMDVPKDARRMHVRAIPRSGGLAMAVGVAVPCLLWLPGGEQLRGLLLAAGVIVGCGLLDDRFDLHYRWKFLGQFVAVALLMAHGVALDHMPLLGVEHAPAWLSWPVTFLFLLGAINAVNLSDGLDGLAAGTSLLSLGLLVLVASAAGLAPEGLACVALMGAIMGFLRYNTHPAQIFMGDAGSQFLGVSVVALAVIISQSEASPVSKALPLIALGLPILDTLMVMAIRLREGRSPFSPDKNHIHHQLMAMGFQHYEVVGVIYLLQMSLISGAYLLRFASDGTLILFYLLFCAAVLALLYGARATGWRWRSRRDARNLQERRNVLLRKFNWYFAHYHHVLFIVLLGVWLAVILQVPFAGADSRDLLLAGMAIFACCAILFHRARLMGARLAAYAVSAIAIYVESSCAGGALVEAVDYALMGLAVLLMLAIRMTRREAFGLTTQDILVLFIIIVVPMLPFAADYQASLGRMAMRLAVMVYTVELLLSRSEFRPSWLLAASGLVLATAGIRAFA